MIRRDVAHTAVLADALSRAPGLVEAVQRHDEEGARDRLRNVVDGLAHRPQAVHGVGARRGRILVEQEQHRGDLGFRRADMAAGERV